MRLLTGLLVLVPSLALAAQNTLTWTDNSTDETSFIIERATAANVPACQTAVTWTQIVTVPANLAPPPSSVMFADSVVTVGTVYCYRIKAQNTEGTSLPSNIMGRVPLGIPAAPTNLLVGP